MIRDAIDWLGAHPVIWQLALWPILSAAVTWLFKPRSPEEYAALPPRVAAGLKLIGALGFDAPKILESIAQVVTGSSKSPTREHLDKELGQ